MDVLMLGMAIGVLVVLAVRLPLPDLPPDGVFALTAGVITFFFMGALAQFGGGHFPYPMAAAAWAPAVIVRAVRGSRQRGGVVWNPFKPRDAAGRSPSSD